jgi:gluconokinase
MLEGIGLRIALIVEQLRSVATAARRLLASGGAVEDLPEWLQIIADVTRLPSALSLEGQTTLRGTALIALEVLAPGVARTRAELGKQYDPNSEHAEAYAKARERQEAAYRCLVRAR